MNESFLSWSQTAQGEFLEFNTLVKIENRHRITVFKNKIEFNLKISQLENNTNY